MSTHLLYTIAFSKIIGLNDKQRKLLLSHFSSAEIIYKERFNLEIPFIEVSDDIKKIFDRNGEPQYVLRFKYLASAGSSGSNLFTARIHNLYVMLKKSYYNKNRDFITKVIGIDKKYQSKLPMGSTLPIPARVFRHGGWVKIKTPSAFNETHQSSTYRADNDAEMDFMKHHKNSLGAPDMGYDAELDTYDNDDNRKLVPGYQTNTKDSEDFGYEKAKDIDEVGHGDWHYKAIMQMWDKASSFGRKKIAGAVSANPNANRRQVERDLRDTDYKEITDISVKLGLLKEEVPATPAEFARCIFDSLAHAYAQSLRELEDAANVKVREINIVGGGSSNELLNQLTADATGLTVIAGPVEATVLGNLIIQMMSAGWIDSLEAGRTLIAKSSDRKTFQPRTVRS